MILPLRVLGKASEKRISFKDLNAGVSTSTRLPSGARSTSQIHADEDVLIARIRPQGLKLRAGSQVSEVGVVLLNCRVQVSERSIHLPGCRSHHGYGRRGNVSPLAFLLQFRQEPLRVALAPFTNICPANEGPRPKPSYD